MRTAALFCISITCVIAGTGCGDGARSIMSTPPAGVSHQPVEHVFFYCWSGTSPGAGFTRTSLTAIEVDLVGKRMRALASSARAPSAMLPHQQEEIEALLARSPWQPLAPERAQGLADMARLWLRTDPPPVYNRPMGLGREDGFAEGLVVRSGSQEREVKVNPHGAARPGDRAFPPPEWYALQAYLASLAGTGIGLGLPLK